MDVLPLAHPLPFRQLLDEAVGWTRRFFRPIYLAVAIPMALATGLVPLAQAGWFESLAGADRQGPDMATFFSRAAVFFLAILLLLVTYGLTYVASIAAAVDAVAGRPVSMGHAYRQGLRPRVLGTVLLAGLLSLAGTLLCILPGIYVALCLSMTLPVMAHERVYGTLALRRSYDVMRHNPRRVLFNDPRFKVFTLGVVNWILASSLNFIVQLPFLVVQQVMLLRSIASGEVPDQFTLMSRLTWLQVPSGLVGGLVRALVNLYACFATALLFFDTLRRKEGADLEAAIIQRSGLPAPGPAVGPALPALE